jgi:hypothetical protein
VRSYQGSLYFVTRLLPATSECILSDFPLDGWHRRSVSSKLMKTGRILLITRLRSVISAAVLGIFLVLSGGALALADGLVELNSQSVASLHYSDATSGVAATGDDCPVCPHSHHSDADSSCCCGHFHTSPCQVFLLEYAPRLVKQEFSESVSTLADVYFERFIPPQLKA